MSNFIITDEMQAEIDAQNEARFQMAIARQNILGALTGWRKLKSNAKQDKILNGRVKMLNLVLG